MTPSHWRTCWLHEVADLEMGETIIAKDLTGDGIPVYSAGRDPKPWGHTSASRKVYTRGTIVIGARGSIGYPRLPKDDRFVSTQTTIAVTPRPGILPGYLHAALGAVDFASITAQQAIPMLTITALKTVRLPVPPPNEQAAIASAIAAADLNVSIATESVERSRDLKRSLLASIMTKGIGQAGRTVSTDLGPAPEGWRTTTVREVGAVVTGSTPSTKEPSYWGGPVPFVTPGDLGASPVISTTQRTVTEAGASAVRRLPKGAVLVTCIASIGKNGIAGRECVTNQQINAVVCDPRVVSPEFFYWAMEWRTGALNLVAGKTAVPIVSKSKFEGFQLALPAQEIQAAAVRALGAAQDVEDRARAEAASLETLKAALSLELLAGRRGPALH